MDITEQYKDCGEFKVWHSEANDPKQLYLKLAQIDDEQIILQVVDHKGELIRGGNLLVVDNEMGVLVALDGTNPVFPLRTDPALTPLVYTEAQMKVMTRKEKKHIAIDLTEVLGKSLKDAIMAKVKSHYECSNEGCKHERNTH